MKKGADPLGSAFLTVRSTLDRRASGAVYTPPQIVESMIHWAVSQGSPARVVDPGCGSGRFILAAAKRFPRAKLVAVDTDPLALLMLRANAAVHGVASRLEIACDDYRRLQLPAIDGTTLFVGNPPYVRHHQIDEAWKSWFATTAEKFGVKASKLAGLHIHFFLRTRELGRIGDYGTFITSAEWIDVNYGAALRHMLADGLGGTSLHVLNPDVMPFDGATTTGAITCFKIGQRSQHMAVRAVSSIQQLSCLTSGKAVSWATLETTNRWSTVVRPIAKPPVGHIELGELFRVHRGQVTGGNDIWIAGAYPGKLPDGILVPTVTKARELFATVPVLTSTNHLRRVIDIPIDFDALDAEDRRLVKIFLKWAKDRHAHESYIASTRRKWWAVNLRPAAPILCTYMARRPPAFVRNLCQARHINIAHGLYPREPMNDSDLLALAVYLSSNLRTNSGRTYAGGLTKFEPRELERVRIPPLEELRGITADMVGTATADRRREGEGRLPA